MQNSKRRAVKVAAIEMMEQRVLLSAAVASVTVLEHSSLTPVLKRPVSDATPMTGDSSPSAVGGLSVVTLRDAYGLGNYGSSNITFHGVQGDGTGQTIALVDAYNDPDIGADLQTFDAGEGLPNPTFTVINETGGTSLPANDVQNIDSEEDWAGEESLDVEWAHAMAPGASILVVECNSDSNSDLYQGVVTAAKYSGVSVVSNSYGGNESKTETSADADFTTPSGHAGVTFVASAGDSPGAIEYPAESPNVVAVGGTQLTVSGNSYSSEVPWDYSSSDGTGGGTSKDEAQPSYQSGTITATKREDPDLSIAGGQNSASSNSYVPIVDSWDFGSGTGWSGEEGTSWSSPMIAGLIAVADQGRAAEGLGTLTSLQTDTRLYQLPTSAYHDITSGSNGHAAVTGYDEASGIGTPIANLFVPDLAGAATITGQIFEDNTGTGVYNSSKDTPLANQTVYLDLNGDGKLDNSEPSTTTNVQGIYSFANEPAGGVVRLSSSTVAGYSLTTGSTTVAYGTTSTVNFTFTPVASKLVITQQPPASASIGTTLAPVIVSIENSTGVVVPNASSTVTLTLSQGTFSGGGSTITVTAVNGIATFSNLQISATGTYTLTASDGSLTSAVSSSLTVAPAAASVLSVKRSTVNVTTVQDGSVTYAVTFSAPVTNVLPGNFTVVTTSNLTANSVVTVAPTTGTSATCSVTVSGVTGYGTLGLNLNGSGITDAYGNALTNAATPVIGQTYLVQDSISLTGSAFYLKLDNSSPQNLEIWTSSTAAGPAAYVQPMGTVYSVALSATAAGDSFTTDFSNGSIVPNGGLTINGYAASASANALTLIGTGTDAVSNVDSQFVTLNNQTIIYSNLGIYLDPQTNESLNVTAGDVTLAPGNSGGITTDTFSSISIAAGAQLNIPTAATHATRMLIETAALNIAGSVGNWTGTLDLSNNDLDLANGNLATLTSQVAEGITTGIGGIMSSAAQSDSAYLTTLGVIQNSVDGSTTGSPLFGTTAPNGPFDGTSPAASDVLIKYTYYGDTNLDGQVDGSDYSRIDAAFSTPAAGWFNGDFNYDGNIDGSDYTLIDNAFNQQSASLAAQVAAPDAVVATPAAQVAPSSKSSSKPAKPASPFSQSPNSASLWQQQQAAEPTRIALSLFNADDTTLNGKFSELRILLG